MSVFTTVLGERSVSEMGICQPHEHVYIAGIPAQLTNELLCINNLAASIAELKFLRAAGGNTIVDANPIATGRDALALAEASRESNIHIIATTGYHIPDFYDAKHWIWDTSQDRLTELFIKELNEGMYLDGIYRWPEYQTKFKAGLVKAMLTKEGLAGRPQELLYAAGQAAVAAGSALMLHTEFGIGAIEAIGFLGRLGLPPERILICHVDRQADDYSIHEAIADTGVYLEYDTITLFEYHDNKAEIQLLEHMIKRGHLDQILISTDPTKDRLKSYGGVVGMDYILTQFIPQLRETGIDQSVVDTITRTNPAKALMRKAGGMNPEYHYLK